MFPNSACYYIAPLQTQAKELIWANGRLQNFYLPKIDPKTGLTHTGLNRNEAFQVFEELKEKYGMKVNNTEMRIYFGNGSFIKLDGADQYEKYRGVTPNIVAYDEFKDFHPKFHEGMDPNLAVFDAPILFVGSPPVGDEPNAENYYDEADFCEKSDKAAHYNLTAYDNPWISDTWLDDKKAELILKGREDEWLREYMAVRIKSGSSSIFPMWDPADPKRGIKHTKHIKPHQDVVDYSMQWHKSWEWFMVFDPASVSTFAVLFGGIHKYKKKIVLLDEIYEQDRNKMTSSLIWGRAKEIIRKYPILTDDIRLIYDNAAAWFARELAVRFDVQLEPCKKDTGRGNQMSKEERIDLIRDILLRPEEDWLLWVSDNCPNFNNEMKGYRTDENGKIPKEDDHLIDDFRYMLSNAMYDELPDPQPELEDERRGFTPEQDARSFNADGMDPITLAYMREEEDFDI